MINIPYNEEEYFYDKIESIPSFQDRQQTLYEIYEEIEREEKVQKQNYTIRSNGSTY